MVVPEWQCEQVHTYASVSSKCDILKLFFSLSVLLALGKVFVGFQFSVCYSPKNNESHPWAIFFSSFVVSNSQNIEIIK